MADVSLPAPDPADTVIDVLEPGLRAPDAPVDEAVVAVAEALAGAGASLWTLSLVSAPMAVRAFEWMRAPRLGDLVLVLAAGLHPVHRVGAYRACWSHRPGEEVYEIETLDGRGITWTNCTLVRLPRNDADHSEMFGYPRQ